MEEKSIFLVERTVAWYDAWGIWVDPSVKTRCYKWRNQQCNLEALAPNFFLKPPDNLQFVL